MTETIIIGLLIVFFTPIVLALLCLWGWMCFVLWQMVLEPAYEAVHTFIYDLCQKHEEERDDD